MHCLGPCDVDNVTTLLCSHCHILSLRTKTECLVCIHEALVYTLHVMTHALAFPSQNKQKWVVWLGLKT